MLVARKKWFDRRTLQEKKEKNGLTEGPTHFDGDFNGGKGAENRPGDLEVPVQLLALRHVVAVGLLVRSTK